MTSYSAPPLAHEEALGRNHISGTEADGGAGLVGWI